MKKHDYLTIAECISEYLNDKHSFLDHVEILGYTRHLAEDVFTVIYKHYNLDKKRFETVEVFVDYGYGGEDFFYITVTWPCRWPESWSKREALSSL